MLVFDVVDIGLGLLHGLGNGVLGMVSGLALSLRSCVSYVPLY
jgi:hypothetical protein